MTMLDNFSIRGKNLILLALVALTFAFVVFATVTLVNGSLQNQTRGEIKGLTNIALDVLKTTHRLQQQGILTEAEAKAQAIATLRESRYKGDGYFFIFEDGICRLLPFLPDKEGTDLSAMEDQNGVRVIDRLTVESHQLGGGYVDYVWPLPSTGEAAPKVSTSRYFEPWNWMIGTGVYQADLNSTIVTLLRDNLATNLSMLGGFIILVLLIFKINNSLLLRILVVKQHLQHFAKGDFSKPVRDSGNDEIGQMLISLSQVREQMQGVVKSLTGTTVQVRNGMVEISEANQDLAQRTERQSSNLASSNQLLKELAQLVHKNTKGVLQAHERATDARTTAARGSEVMRSAVKAMSAITTSSSQVNDIVDVIDGLAFQTNLLALNAAVEAARAGEQGRGFAVVASEVRALAQRSSESAAQIKALIETSGEAVREGVGVVNQSETILDEIVASTTDVGGLLDQVASATEEQNQGIDQTSEAVAELDNFMQQSAALVEQVAVSSRNLVVEVDGLAQEIAFFTVEESTESPFERAASVEFQGSGQTHFAPSNGH